MNDFKIVILGYYIHLFDSIAFIGLQCPILNAPCNLQRFCINNYACPNYLNKVLVLSRRAHALCGMNPTPHGGIRMAQRLNVPTKSI